MAFRQFLREAPLTRPLYGALRWCYLVVRAFLYRSIQGILSRKARSRGYKVFRWKDMTIKEAWNDSYNTGMLLNGLKQFTNMAVMVEKLAPPSPVIFDIGANIGLYSFACSRIDGAIVHGFEPVLGTYAMFEDNVVGNGLNNVTAHHLGISNSCSDREIRTSPEAGDTGGFSTNLAAGSSAAASETPTNSEFARFSTLDAFMEEHAIDRLDVLKIRIQGQGHEVAVLEGGLHCIERFKPVIHLIYYQVKFEENGVSTDIFLELVRRFGYRLHVYNDMDASLKLVNASEYFALRDQGMVDLMFIPDQRV